MVDGAEYSGRTLEDAVTQAAADRGVAPDDLRYDVLSQGSRGVFGIGAEDARILVRNVQALEPVVDQTVTESADEFDYEHEDESGEESRPGERPPTGVDLAEEGREVLATLLLTMNFEAEVSIRSTEDPIMLGITGENLGVLIGRRGDNLAALQFMVNLLLSRNRRQWPRVVLDVENYRERREEALKTLADRIAFRVQRNGRPFTLEAMPAGDRRIIHLALRENDSVETYSIGEGPTRRVVIAPVTPGRPGETT